MPKLYVYYDMLYTYQHFALLYDLFIYFKKVAKKKSLIESISDIYFYRGMYILSF
jgi:hypothetical protein